ncbi:MAG: FGGY family carbohydrate kinase, partial [Actinomycetes bacterium]
MAYVLSIDAGTTGIRTYAVDGTGALRMSAYREFPQHFPRPGWVEHDADEIWAATIATLTEVVDRITDEGATVAGIGITNQRETVVAWDRRTGRPRHRAIVWQDRRTAARCDALRDAGFEPTVRARTGLVLDPYFSGSKVEWLLAEGGVEADPDLAIGTVDSWLVWNLTGGRVHATDPSNASRTMLLDITTLAWSDELCDRFGVPIGSLPEVMPSSGRFGVTDPDRAAGLTVPVSGIAGDQQAALFGQACFERGMAKNTYGTGSFVLVNLGPECPAPAEGLLTTVAWTIGGATTYAMEGSIFVTGAAVQWLRDGLGIIERAEECGPLAETVPDTGGVALVPAFTGLGSPYWDPYARGAIVGITRGTTRAHIARAVVEAMALQTADVMTAIDAASGTAVAELRVDGGASAMDLLCQFQADLLGVTVRRPAEQGTTALGAA